MRDKGCVIRDSSWKEGFALRAFEYFQPKTVSEVVELLGQYGERSKLLAGGTDLIIFMQMGKFRPDYVIDLSRVEELRGISYDESEGLSVRAMTTIREIELSRLINEKYPHLAQSARQFGSIQIRNLATLGGNVCTASPAGDTLSPLLALDARARVVSLSGERVVPLEKVFIGAQETSLAPDELLVELLVPPPPPRTSGHYIKLTVRKAMDVAIVGVAATLTLSPEDNVVKDVKIALGAVAPTPIRAHEAEEVLKSRPLDDAVLSEAALAAMEASRPITDVRASAEYRRAMVEVLTRRAVRKAAELAANE